MSRAKRKRLTAAEAREVRSLIEDGGYTREEADAWVRRFGVTDVASPLTDEQVRFRRRQILSSEST